MQGRLTEEQERADSAAQTAKQHLADAKSELQDAWSKCDSQQAAIQQLEVRGRCLASALNRQQDQPYHVQGSEGL